MGKTAIEWTARPGTQGESWNPVTGCTKVSEGCRHCYAETMAKRFVRTGVVTHEGRDLEWSTADSPEAHRFDVLLHPDRLETPLRWRKPRRVFVNSMSDLFHPDVPDAFIDRVFAVMALCPQHVFQVLTKRPERMREYFAAPTKKWTFIVADEAGQRWPRGGPHRISDALRDFSVPLLNLWLGVSVEDQATADARIPLLFQTPAALRFVSAEPLLGPIDLTRWLPITYCGDGYRRVEHEASDFGPMTFLDWVIVGGESGPAARPCRVAWIRSIVKQCQGADVPVFVKQVGAYAVDRNDRLSTEGPGCDPCDPRDWPEPERGWDDGSRGNIERLDDGYQGAPVHIRLKSRKGNDPAEWPADLRVREFPGGAR